MNAARTLSIATCALALGLTQAAAPSHANACAGRACSAGAILPVQGELPANAVEVIWRRTSHHNTATQAATPAPTPHLYLVEGNARVELEIVTEYKLQGLAHVKPRKPVPPGGELVFEYDETCGFATAPGLVSASFKVGPEVTPPTEVGFLRAEINRGPVTVTGGSMCTDSIEAAYADLTLVLSDAARPYADGLRHQLVVDGERVQSYGYHRGPHLLSDPIGASVLGAGKDRLYVRCGGSSGTRLAGEVAEGAHRVQFEVLLPDDTMIATPAVDVDLRCDDSLRAPSSDTGAKYDAGAPERASSGGSDTPADEGRDTAESVEADTAASDGTSSSEVADATIQADVEESVSDDDGCSVAAGAHSSSSLLLVLLGLVGAAWRRSRKQAAGRCSPR